ncbi:MAG: hypothetical protein HYV07_32415 [Deltaproteobacteria bacterium]|nr:hypothetical protein [Deltaproteobacteria bacterium]
MSRDTKSRCPGWTEDRNVRERLIADALKDPDRGDDARGRPKILWNAAEGMYFIGVSTGQQEAVYNCYPEVPATSLYEQLEARARRSVSQVLADNGSEDR